MAGADPIDVIVRETAIRFGRELRIAAMGLSQREVARRAGISQSHLSRVIRGLVVPDLELCVRLTNAVGHRFWFKLYPVPGDRLRDSRQLRLAEVVESAASPKWRFQMEVPVGPPGDLRAADLVMDQDAEEPVSHRWVAERRPLDPAGAPAPCQRPTRARRARLG